MCCLIVARKSVAPSSGDLPEATGTEVRLWTRSRILKKKSFIKIFITPLAAADGPPQVCNLNKFLRATCFFCLSGFAGGP